MYAEKLSVCTNAIVFLTNPARVVYLHNYRARTADVRNRSNNRISYSTFSNARNLHPKRICVYIIIISFRAQIMQSRDLYNNSPVGLLTVRRSCGKYSLTRRLERDTTLYYPIQ